MKFNQRTRSLRLLVGSKSMAPTTGGGGGFMLLAFLDEEAFILRCCGYVGIIFGSQAIMWTEQN